MVEKGSKGLTTSKIENKYALRMVQNADIVLDNVFVPENNRLAKATDFATGANKCLEHSRIKVGWGACGLAAGAYEAALRYTMARKQFGRPIASFQLSQLKLSKMLGMCEAMLALIVRLQQQADADQTTIGQIGRAKGLLTSMGREVCQMAREICGGNGILLENRVMKAMMDMEALHTYEGTFEVNMLVSGREITGFNAIKK
jgi:alkylation response protein AidB-like acyl-CoA dehydrogenase